MSKPGRNDPCHCGSGQKYKKCHLAAEAQAKADAAEAEEKEKEEAAGKTGDRPQARPKDAAAGALKSRAPAPTQAPAFRRKSV